MRILPECYRHSTGIPLESYWNACSSLRALTECVACVATRDTEARRPKAERRLSVLRGASLQAGFDFLPLRLGEAGDGFGAEPPERDAVIIEQGAGSSAALECNAAAQRLGAG